MSRFQLSLNVADVEASVEFYTKLFGVGPAKHRPGYANFVVTEPPMKFIVIEDEGEPGTINHVGIEFETSEEVAAETARAADAGLPVHVDDPHTCCFATQEKAWTQDSDGVPWELYTVVAQTEGFGASSFGGTPLDKMLPPIGLDELRQGIDDPDVVVIDAQGDGGFEKAHIEGALNFGLENVAAQAVESIGDPNRRVLLYCTDRDCLGAEFIGTQLVEAGYTNVGRFVDGVAGWRDAGMPIASSEKC